MPLARSKLYTCSDIFATPAIRLPESAIHVRGSAVPVARSYNGNTWEASMATTTSPVSFECTTAAPVVCSTTLPAGATYQLRTYNGSALVSQDPKVFVSRFLTQATFGPTLDDIDSLSAATVEETEAALEGWLIGQMEMEPSLHRAYLRRRENAPVYNSLSSIVRDPCSEASSWVTFAFSKFDQGKLVDVSLAADGSSYSLSVEGIVRTVVESTKDVREDDGHSCFRRGFRTPLDRCVKQEFHNPTRASHTLSIMEFSNLTTALRWTGPLPRSKPQSRRATNAASTRTAAPSSASTKTTWSATSKTRGRRRGSRAARGGRAGPTAPLTCTPTQLQVCAREKVHSCSRAAHARPLICCRLLLTK
jgi:hypothetical protein